MRTLAIGDIHGCIVALTTLLERMAPTKEDRIVFLGDYIDRGPASREVVETLLDLSQITQCTFLRGNHEVMVLSGREDEVQSKLWQSYGGFETLESYGVEYDPNWRAILPEPHWKFFENTERYFETDTHIFVHACLDAEADLPEQADHMLYWEYVSNLKAHKSGKRVICGHSHQRSGEILNLGFGVCIDTAAVYGQWLTCLDVDSGEWVQANESGETRTGFLAGPESGTIDSIVV